MARVQTLGKHPIVASANVKQSTTYKFANSMLLARFMESAWHVDEPQVGKWPGLAEGSC